MPSASGAETPRAARPRLAYAPTDPSSGGARGPAPPGGPVRHPASGGESLGGKARVRANRVEIGVAPRPLRVRRVGGDRLGEVRERAVRPPGPGLRAREVVEERRVPGLLR